jgi:arginine exporter protein ArgO
MNTQPFLQGMLAGYGIAIPVGAIAILIVEMGLRRGFKSGFFAGAGAASADVAYASLAALAGSQLILLLEPVAQGVQVLSGWILVLLGANGMVKAWRRSQRTRVEPAAGSGMAIYSKFLGLTLLNPLTVAYFAALILAGTALGVATAADRLWFVLGAGIASLSWQTFLAGVGAWGNRRLSDRARLFVSVLGNMVVVGLGVRILF